MQIGPEKARYEQIESYPVNQVGMWTGVSLGAYGKTAAARRASRAELWRKPPNILYGGTSPLPARDTFFGFVSTTPEGTKKVKGRRVLSVIESIRKDPRFDADGLAAEASRFAYGNFSSPRDNYKPPEGATSSGPVGHGLTLRVLIPYGDARVSQIRLDGRLLDHAAYSILQGPGTIVEIGIAPEKVAEFHIVSCRYETPTVRRPGFRPDDW